MTALTTEQDEVVSFPKALAQAASVPGTGPLTAERIALLRLYQRSLAVDEPDPMVPVTSADLLALLDAAERGSRVAAALRESAKWRDAAGDFEAPRALESFADSIDPTSEDYDPNQDPLVSR